MRRVASLLLVTSCLICVTGPARASNTIVIGLWPQNYTQLTEIQSASGISIPYFRGRMRDGQFDSSLVGTDAHTAASHGLSLGLNIQPKTGSGSNRTGILYTTISAQIQAQSGTYYDKLVSMANEVLALPTYGVVPNYLQFHSEASTQAAPGVLAAQPYSGTGPEYQVCYALVHQLFESLGVTDKIYWQVVLSRTTYAGNQGGPESWFPSDPSLYDLVGVDAYYRSSQWLSPASAFGAASTFAQGLGKQFWIDEVGADEGGPSNTATGKADWFSALGTYLETHRGSLAGVVFSHASDGANWFLDSKLSGGGGRTNPNYSGTSWVGWKTAAMGLATLPTRTLSAAVAGTGAGTVTSTPSGIACPGDCSEDFGQGDPVDLSAVADPGSVFTGWSGDCTGSGACAITMDTARNVTATFELTHDLTVVTAGGGVGNVVSDIGGIDCPATSCAANGRTHNTHVVLTAAPDPGSVLAGWSGGGCGGTTLTCDVTMSSDKTVTATFTSPVALTVTMDGGGAGTVTTPPNGIDCPSVCTYDFAENGSVTLHAVADANSIFIGWSGDCVGTDDCVLIMDVPHNVTATFEPTWNLHVARAGAGGGTVTSDVGAIECGAICSDDFQNGTVVTLMAADGPNSVFTSWSGDTAGGCLTPADCVVMMDQARNITAHYDPILQQLSVTSSGTGTGTVTSLTPNLGIDCGATCQWDFQQGSSVVLHGAPEGSSDFVGWSGGGCSGISDCTVSIDVAKSVDAQFDLAPLLLTVTKAGNGGGSVTSDVGGINCGTTCSASYSDGSSVVLHAAPDGTSDFIGWSGGGCSGISDCTVTMDTAKSVDAQFDLAPRLLTVTKAGNGNGSVTSDVGGIDCPGTCGTSYPHGTAVVLTANLGSNSTFTGWSGGVCAGISVTCNLTMDGAKDVTATFTLIQHLLSVTKSGTGTGLVASDLSGISCGATCSADYDHGTSVVLTATPDANVSFAGWGGACAGLGTCNLSMDAAKAVSATFNLVPRTLTVTKAGTGTGAITSNIGGINCPGTCVANYDHGTAVILTATPGVGSTFGGWSGGVCSGLLSTCNVTMDAAKAVTATFTLIPHLLSVTKAGTGTGAITSNTGGINCGSTCSASYDHGTVVILTATPSGGATFAGWSGGVCAGALTTCNVTMDAAKSVTGTFNPPVTVTTMRDSDPAVTYNGWLGLADAQAIDGFLRNSDVKDDTATWKSPPTTSIKWITRTGPAQGKASVTIDGVNKGTVDLYSAASTTSNKVYSGLTNKAHTIVIKVLHTKSTASTGYNVRLDAFVAGTTTRQASDPTIQYNAWKSTTQALATDGTYRSSATSSASIQVTFTGTSIDWITTKGKVYGMASVKIDGVAKGTVDLYQSATGWRSSITYGALSSGLHTMLIQVLGQKNAHATGKTVVLDGFIVHG